MFKSVFCLAAALIFSASALAQSGGSIKGKVKNMRGDGIANATVSARQNSKDIRSVKANSKGEFVLSNLTPGEYDLVFDGKGYSSGIKHAVQVTQNKTVDLGDRLIMQVDRGTFVIVQGSVFFKNGTSVPNAKINIERINADGSTKKMGSIYTDIRGEFVFRQPEGSAKFRLTAKFKDASATKELEVDSAAIYRLAISLDAARSENN